MLPVIHSFPQVKDVSLRGKGAGEDPSGGVRGGILEVLGRTSEQKEGEMETGAEWPGAVVKSSSEMVGHILPLLSLLREKLSQWESLGVGMRLQLGLLSSTLGLLSFASLGLLGIRLDEEPLITHSVNIRKTTKLFT